MQIVEATAWDMPEVHKCFQLLNIEGVDYFTGEVCSELINREVVVLAKEGDEILGAMAVTGEYGYLKIFAIACLKQGVGVGQALVKYAESLDPELEHRFVEVDSYHFYNAWGFYEKLGYNFEQEWNDGFALGRRYVKYIDGR